MYVVDASVWVAWFSAHDVFHDDSRQWLTGMMTGSVRLIEPVPILAEVAGAVSWTLNDEKAAERAVAMLSTAPLLSLLPVDLALARRAAAIASSLGMRGYDALYVALAEVEGMSLVSWDSDHLSRASQLVPVYRPSDLLTQYRSDQ